MINIAGSPGDDQPDPDGDDDGPDPDLDEPGEPMPPKIRFVLAGIGVVLVAQRLALPS